MREPTRKNIEEAYATMGLPPGTSYAKATEEYRFLAATFHPDRAFNNTVKEKTADKLKDLNAAREILDEHFNGPKAKHQENSTCICKPLINPAQSTKPVGGDSADISAKEAMARARTERRRAGNETSESAPASSPAPENKSATLTASVDQFARLKFLLTNEGALESFLEEESFRWKAAGIVLLILIALWMFSLASQAIIRPGREAKAGFDGKTYHDDPYRYPGDPHYGEPKP